MRFLCYILISNFVYIDFLYKHSNNFFNLYNYNLLNKAIKKPKCTFILLTSIQISRLLAWGTTQTQNLQYAARIEKNVAENLDVV